MIGIDLTDFFGESLKSYRKQSTSVDGRSRSIVMKPLFGKKLCHPVANPQAVALESLVKELCSRPTPGIYEISVLRLGHHLLYKLCAPETMVPSLAEVYPLEMAAEDPAL